MKKVKVIPSIKLKKIDGKMPKKSSDTVKHPTKMVKKMSDTVKHPTGSVMKKPMAMPRMRATKPKCKAC